MRVPQYEQQVRPTPLRAEQNIRAPAEAFGAGIGQAFQQAGQQVGQVASLVDRRLEEHAKEDAELQAMQAYADASAATQKLFYEGDAAIYQRRGAQAMGASKEAAVELKRIGEETSATLTSPYAKQSFDKLWLRHRDGEIGAVSRHEAGQRREYRDQVTAGVLATSQNMATLRYNDPAEVANQIDIGTLAIRSNSKGLPPEQVNAQALAFSSGVHKAVTLRMATDNPLAANEYYKRHADDFTAEDNVTLQRTLAPAVKRGTARVEADRIIDEVSTGKASLPSTIAAAQEQVESGGKQTAVSSAGNYGVMQINDASGQEAAAALGIAWDPAKARSDAAYNRQLGQKYMQIQLDKYGGNRALALAAYNAGPGRVEEWIKAYGDPRTGDIADAAWIAKLPIKETRDYYAKVEAIIGKGVQQNIDLTAADRKIEEQFKDDPEMADAVRARVTQQSNLREAERRDRENEAWRKGFEHVHSGGSVDNLPPDVLEHLPATRLADLERLEDARTKGKDKPENPAEFDRLMTKSVEDPEAFVEEDPTKWELPKAQVAELIRRKGALMTKEAKEEAKSNDIRKAVTVTKDIMLNADIDSTPKEGTSAAKKYNAYVTKLSERLEEFRQKEGRRPTDAEIREIGQDLTLPGRLNREWLPDPEKRPFELTDDERARWYLPIDKIPTGEVADIRARLGTRGKDDSLVEQIYAAVRRKDKAEVQRLLGGAKAPPATTVTVPNPVS